MSVVIPELRFGALTIPTHDFFVVLGVVVASVVFVLEARRRGALREESLFAVAGAGRRRDRDACVRMGRTSRSGAQPHAP